MSVVGTVLTIHPNEKCYGLVEGRERVREPSGAEVDHWVQRVKVLRGDRLVEWVCDYGRAEDYTRRGIQEILIPNWGDDSVAAMQYEAEKNRNDDYWAKRVAEMKAESTLIKDHLELLEKSTLSGHNRSHLGPHVNVQRDSYPRQYAEREIIKTIKEKKQRGK